MVALRAAAGRSKGKTALVGAMLTVVAGSLVLWTGFPSAFASDGGGSATLAELAARSPGARIGGIALKAKPKRNTPFAMVRSAAAPGEAVPAGLGAPIPDSSLASALGAGPSIFGPLPSGVAAPGLAVAPAPIPGGGFGFVPVPGGGGVIIGPGGGGTPGGGTPGGGSAITPTPSPTGSPNPQPTDTPIPTPTPTVTPPAIVPTPTATVPPVAAVPEPATWLMLIAGFGFVGGALRARRRIRRLA